jgi:hypothetical protein
VVCACVDAGVAAFRRDTLSTTEKTSATSGRWLFSPILGVRGRVLYQRRVTSTVTFGAGVEAGIDALLAPPRFQFVARQGGEPLIPSQLWPVEPRGALVLEIRSP